MFSANEVYSMLAIEPIKLTSILEISCISCKTILVIRPFLQ